jgi:hypothetical protein
MAWCYGREFPQAGLRLHAVREREMGNRGRHLGLGVGGALSLSLSYTGVGLARVTPSPTLGQRPRLGRRETLPQVISLHLI